MSTHCVQAEKEARELCGKDNGNVETDRAGKSTSCVF